MRTALRYVSVAAGFIAGATLGVFAARPLIASSHAAPPTISAKLKATFQRPDSIPFPENNAFSEEKRALGEALFSDPRLSADGKVSCASCHQAAAGYADPRERSTGVPNKRLARHTPGLWNAAWSRVQFWDGRAHNLEDQVAFPVENPDEMAQPMPAVIDKIRADVDYVRRFAAAFPEAPDVSSLNLAKAIATYERTLMSPATRFDRWLAGDAKALSAKETQGFRLFTGKAQCSNCHDGWTFSDSNFYDIGLPDDDRGRGAVLKLPAADHAFKTPTLRELTRSAPYMHDGSLATLEDVIRHYERGITARKTLPPELPRKLSLTAGERDSLVAFLKTLSSEDPPTPPPTITPAVSAAVAAVETSTVSQHDKAFFPQDIQVKRGTRIWIVNNDTRTHNVRVFDPKFEFDSGAQEPGEVVEMAFPTDGRFLVFCGIHPKMEMHVTVAP